jgi:hypothetical protein
MIAITLIIVSVLAVIGTMTGIVLTILAKKQIDMKRKTSLRRWSFIVFLVPMGLFFAVSLASSFLRQITF